MRFAHLAALGLVCSFAATGCSDPPAVPAKGGFSLQLAPQEGEAQKCNFEGNELGMIGMVSTESASGTVPDDPTKQIDIKCSVIGTSKFKVDASADADSTDFDITIDNITSKATQTDPAKGTVVFANPGTSGEAFASPTNGCDFYFTGDQTVDAGKIWVGFNCPAVISGMNTCAISDGIAVFEDCTETNTPD